MNPRDTTFVIWTTALTLATVILIVAFALAKGLYDPHVDNDKIFAVIGPAFNIVIGCFVGILSALGGYAFGQRSNGNPPPAPDTDVSR